MLPYSLDFFNSNARFITNSNVDGIAIKQDYISGGDNQITILNTDGVEDISQGGYIRISRQETNQRYFGYITGITKDAINNSTITIKWTDLLSVFNVDWCIDTDVQHSGTALEAFMAEQMQQIAANVLTPGGSGISLQFTTTSSTTDWGFNLKSNHEGQHSVIVNFRSTIITRALKEYDIAINIEPEYGQEQITLKVTIGKITENPKTIEADLANVISKKITMRDSTKDVNRLKVYNQENYAQTYTYYLGTDGNIHRVDQDGDNLQKYPVIFDTTDVKPSPSFVSAALAEARSTFKQVSYLDLIEIEVANKDTLVNPLELSITQKYDVIFDGTQYTTILTGKQTKSGTTVLTFGTNRLDLTQILRKRG